MKSKGILLLVLLVCIVAGIIVFNLTIFNSEHQMTNYFIKNAEALQSDAEAMLNDPSRNSDFAAGIEQVTVREGEHTMVEYLAGATKKAYIGFYYSPDDVPLPYQNSSAELTQTEEYYWSWQENDGRTGITVKLADKWYYFELAL